MAWPLNFAVWMTWSVIVLLAVLLTTRRSASALRRWGFSGLARPRWWFQLAYISWNLTTVMLTAALLSVFQGNQRWQWLDGVFSLSFAASAVTFPAFLIFGAIGYLLSFVRRLPRTGRAFECVHYFYCILGPTGLLTAAALLLPPQAALRDMAGPAYLGVAGIVWLVVGFASIVRRYERWERKQSCLG